MLLTFSAHVIKFLKRDSLHLFAKYFVDSLHPFLEVREELPGFGEVQDEGNNCIVLLLLVKSDLKEISAEMRL